MSLPPLKFKAVVPARYASTRLPAKPLLDLGGKPMVARVAECAVRSGAEEVWVATDHEGVRDAVQAAGGKVLLTTSGTTALEMAALLCGIQPGRPRGKGRQFVEGNGAVAHGDRRVCNPVIVAVPREMGPPGLPGRYL